MIAYCKDMFEAAGPAALTRFAAVETALAKRHNPQEMSGFVAALKVTALNTLEISWQHLRGGSVIATLPIMAPFLGLGKFMTKGLIASSVKG